MGDLSGTRVLLLEGFARQIMPMMQALHELGCHVTTLNTSRLDLGYASRYPDQRLITFWDRNDMAASFNSLQGVITHDKYDVVIPLTDFSATLLSRHKEELSAFAAIAANDWEVFRMASDKQNTMRACVENDIPCPNTLFDVENLEDVIESDIEYPFIIKPRVGYGSIGFHRIDNEGQLRSVFARTAAEHGNMLVQEYIPQTDKQYKAQLFMDREGNAKSACVFDKTRWYPIDGGSTCCSSSVHRPDIVENSTRLLQDIGWKGYADVDLIQDPRDNTAKVMEINPRITASVKVCFAAGVDFARQIIEFETGRDVTEYHDYRPGCTLRYMHTDLLWFLQSSERFKVKPSWFSFRNTTDQIFSLHDPWPWFTYSLQAIKKLVPELRKRKR